MVFTKIKFNESKKKRIRENIENFIINDLSKIIYNGVDLRENEVFLNITLDEKTLRIKHYISYNNNSIDLGVIYLVEGFNMNCVEESITNEKDDKNGGIIKSKIDYDEIDDFLDIIQVDFLVKELENIDLDELGYII